ncbi:hypothetical protein [Romeriopsis navalis]|nr:hypothetical protein [Romeriopsis navalis]
MQYYSRAVLVGIGLIGLSASLANVLLRPTPKQRATQPLSLPTSIAVSQWQFSHSEAILPINYPERYDRVLSGQRYYYTNAEANPQSAAAPQLTIELRDVTETESDIGLLQSKHLNTDFTSTQAKDATAPKGIYRLFSDTSQSTKLHTCISPTGQLSVTAEQFQKQRYQEAINVHQISGWLLGRSNLLNDRCLWVRIRMNPEPDDPAQLSKVLQDIQSQVKLRP